jgi:hypothetical protein
VGAQVCDRAPNVSGVDADQNCLLKRTRTMLELKSALWLKMVVG